MLFQPHLGLLPSFCYTPCSLESFQGISLLETSSPSQQCGGRAEVWGSPSRGRGSAPHHKPSPAAAWAVQCGWPRLWAASAETAAWHEGFGPVVQSVLCRAISGDGEVPCHPVVVVVAVAALGANVWLERAAGQAGSPADWVI